MSPANVELSIPKPGMVDPGNEDVSGKEHGLENQKGIPRP
jgi:hypothetical protein